MKAILDILHKWCNWNSRTPMQQAVFGFSAGITAFDIPNVTITGKGEFVYTLNNREVHVTLPDNYTGHVTAYVADENTNLIVRGDEINSIACPGSNISAIDVSSCTSLRRLFCMTNDIETLNVAGCTNLNYLHCFNNRIRKLNLSGLTNLISFICRDNLLSELNVTGCLLINDFVAYCDNARPGGSTLTISGNATRYAAIKAGIEAKGWTVITV